MKTILLALSAPAIGTVGQLLLKHVMRGLGPVGAGALPPLNQIVVRLSSARGRIDPPLLSKSDPGGL